MTVSPTLQEAQAAGFSLGGEPSVAIDLVDTVIHAHAEDATDLLATRGAAWWELESRRLPDDAIPRADEVDRLRSALRELFEARIDGHPLPAPAVERLNRAASAAESAPQLQVDGDAVRSSTRWRTRRDGDARLATIARDGIAVLADPERAAQLRRCGNPTCSMLFLAENPRRQWCASNVCGNRMRVARHQERQRRG